MLGGEWCEETDDAAKREQREQVVEAAAGASLCSSSFTGHVARVCARS